MTGPEMNARTWKKTVSGAGFAVLATLGGCQTALDVAESPDPGDTVRIAEVVNANRVYPRWEDFPRAGTDGVSPAQVRAEVGALKSGAAELETRVAAIDWTGLDAGVITADVRARLSGVPVSPDAARTREDVEAFARDLRERARPPAPINRP